MTSADKLRAVGALVKRETMSSVASLRRAMTSSSESTPLLSGPTPPTTAGSTSASSMPADQLERIDEETLPDYEGTVYYPAAVGQLLRNRYRVLGKLGFGAYSTVWLCRDLR